MTFNDINYFLCGMVTKKYLLQEKNLLPRLWIIVNNNGSMVSIPHLYCSDRVFTSEPTDFDNKKHNKEIITKPLLENTYSKPIALRLTAPGN